MRKSIAYLAAAVLAATGCSAGAAEFVVTNTDDSGPGSLRQAMADANVDAAQDTITFNIPGAGVQVINVGSAPLPELVHPVLIEGHTQPGSRPNTLAVGNNAVILIHVRGPGILQNGSVIGAPEGFIVSGGNTRLRGLAITRFGTAILLSARYQRGGNVIQGNLIGLEPTGTGANNNNTGVDVFANESTIGGNAPEDRNVISANGIGIYGFNRAGTIAGNYIGTDPSGTVAVPNGIGIYLPEGGTASSHFVIGGRAAGAGNVISGNGSGIRFGESGTYGGGHGGYVDYTNYVTIAGNRLGTTADGRSPLGNQGSAVYVAFGSNNTIGGMDPADGNIIAFNGAGVFIGNGHSNRVLSNSIYANRSLPISLWTSASGNDPKDADGGPNNLQNYPMLTSSVIANGFVTSNGTLNSTPNSEFLLQFFADSRSITTPGQTYLGSTTLTTDANGDAPFSVRFPINDGNVFINATATSARGDTSQFYYVPPRLVNIATRLRAGTGDNMLIGGFIVRTQSSVVLRGLGPSLNVNGTPIPGALQDPVIYLYDGTGRLLGISDNWKNDNSERDLGLLAPSHDLESALIRNLAPGSYTVQVSGKDGGTGVALMEAYQISTSAGDLANISTRGLVGSGDDVMIGGFIAAHSNGPARYVIRAIGPSLATAGISSPLADPTLELYDVNGALIDSNDNWKDGEQSTIREAGLAPQSDAEAVIVTTQEIGAYTAVVRGKNGGTGVGLVEVYNLQ